MLVPSQHPGGWKSSALVKDRKAQQREIRDSPQQQEIRDFTATTDPGGQQRTTTFHPAPRATFLLAPTPQTAKPGMLRQGRAELLCQHDLVKVQIAKKKKNMGTRPLRVIFLWHFAGISRLWYPGCRICKLCLQSVRLICSAALLPLGNGGRWSQQID